MKVRNGTGAKGSDQVVVREETTGNRRTPTRATDKPFSINKKLVYEAYKAVKSNAGASGVDGQSIEQFEADLQNNLYKIWNRMSSGSYFPPPVRAVSIPKKSGGQRILGVPTVADRVAQMVVKQVIEPDLEPLFLADFMAIGRENRPSMLLGSRASDAGNTTGFWSSTSRVCSTISTTRLCCGLSAST